MRTLVTFLVFLLTIGAVQAQEFSSGYSKGAQPALSQALQWVSAEPAAASSLPDAFSDPAQGWTFTPYAAETVLPTSNSRDVWLRFTVAATPTPQSWIVRLPQVDVQKASMFDANSNGFWPVQLAGASIAHSAWTRSTRTPSFEVFTSNLDKTFYLRLEHHSPISERPELMSQADFAAGAARVGTLLGVMLGMFGMLLIACVAAFGLARNTVFISLAAFTTASLLHYLVEMGYGSWRIWPDSVYLNQATPLAAPLIAMAAGCWLFAQASQAKDISVPAYRLLCLVALSSLGLALAGLTSVDQIHRNLLSLWTLLVLWLMVMSLLWLSLRGMRGNLWLLAGLLPIAAAGASRLAYNYGWLAHMESALVASVFLTGTGLVWLFGALIWRSRGALLSSDLATALNELDPISGLIQQRVVLTRLPRMLRRATQLNLGCGVIVLRWLNYSQIMSAQSAEKQDAMLKHLGLVLNRVARDIDTAAHLDEGHFIILVEGPISKSTLSLLSTQILTACIRASEQFDQPNGFSFHIAIWQGTLGQMSADEVMQELKAQLDRMSSGTKRPVQFVDAPASDEAEADQESTQRRDVLIAKIDAIEASSGVRGIMRPEKPAK